MATTDIQFDAQALQPAPTNSAPQMPLDGTNVKTIVRAFDDTIEEFAHGTFRVPDNIVASGTVTFSVAVMAATVPGAPKQIVHTFGWVALEDHEDFDVAYTDEDSGPGTITADEDYIEIHEWTETVATLGWNGGDLILFRYSKVDVPGGDHLVGDTYLFHLTVKIPV